LGVKTESIGGRKTTQKIGGVKKKEAKDNLINRRERKYGKETSWSLNGETLSAQLRGQTVKSCLRKRADRRKRERGGEQT